MKYEEIELIKQSAKSTVHLVREKDSGKIFIRKVLKGQHPVYTVLQEHSHPFLPAVHEVVVTDDTTTVVEEYIEGEPSGNEELTQAQFLSLVGELCSVLEFLHGQGIIHRDVKPSNIIMSKDGHIRLIDFDAARQPKDDLEQDTVLLGTRGFAPPEQYGFAQTDERADIYSLGVTLTRLGGKVAEKAHYKRVIRKCTDMDPVKRYQSVRQVRRAFFRTAISFRGRILPHGKSVLCAAAAFCIILLVWSQAINLYGQHGDEPPVNAGGTLAVEPPAVTEGPTAEPPAATEAPTVEPPAATEAPTAEPSADAEGTLAVPPAPANPHWDGDTGIAVWGNVLESFYAGNLHYYWYLYRKAENTAPDTDEDELVMRGSMSGNQTTEENFDFHMSNWFKGNGFYYFTVCAQGDGIHYSDSSYVTSDLFEYTGESAPELPLPTDLAWVQRLDSNWKQIFYATWGNLDEYEDSDYFYVTVYDKDGERIMQTGWTKETILSKPVHGISMRAEYLNGENNKYRFVVRAVSSRPNEYRSTSMPDPIPEEYYSPWLEF